MTSPTTWRRPNPSRSCPDGADGNSDGADGSPDGADDEQCRTEYAYLSGSGMLPGGTVVIAPGSTPAVVPPLGWALSELSQARYRSAMATAAGCEPETDDEIPTDVVQVQTSTTRGGQYAPLEKFAEVIGFDPCAALGMRQAR
jgi:hypothetical protein